MKLGQITSYSKVKVEGNQYACIEIEEKVVNLAEIVDFVEPVKALVISTGAYGQIKFTIDGLEYTSENPFSNYIDRRVRMPFYGVHQKEGVFKVINLDNVEFNLSAVKMSDLHNKIYLNRHNLDDWWIEIPNEYHG
jgi:hypothetical protein